MAGPILLQIILIFLNATFASAEIAVISMSESRLRMLTADGNVKAERISKLTEQPAKFLATIQVAITLAGLLGSAFAADSFAGPLVEWLLGMGIAVPEKILKSFCVFLITLILAYFSLVFGELVPKQIAMKKAEAMALGLSGILYGVSKAFAPLVSLLTASTNLVLRLLGIDPNKGEEKVSEEEIRMLLMEGSEQGTIHKEETEMIENIFEFNDISVDQICTHRREIVSLDKDESLEEWQKVITESRHTYYPVWEKESDNIIGILDTKDYFRLKNAKKEELLVQAVDAPYFIPETMRANVLFRNMRLSRKYFAVIIDEYGGLSGIITLHDLMETIVGELYEEEEIVKPSPIEQIGENKWRIYGYADLDQVAKRLKMPLPVEKYDTYGGFICGIINRVPQEGEKFECEFMDMQIKVHSVENHCIGSTTLIIKN